MNIPIKVLKSNSIANEKVRNQQKIAQKYHNSVINSKPKSSLNENKNVNEKSNSQNQIKNIHNIFSTTNLKEEIIRWFFSFGLNHKLVLSTIENKWLINCLHFMYTKLKNEPNTKFSYLDGEAPECGIENLHHKFSGKQPIIFTNKKMSNNLFFHFFSTIEDTKKSYTNYSNCYGINNISFNCGSSSGSSLINNVNNNNIYYNNKENSEFDFFNEINFYKCEESDISNDYCSYMALSEKIIENEVYFLKIFDYYSKEKAFTNFIPAFLDLQSKYYTYGMPNWFNKKESYSLQEILIAYFEQTITVKFVLFHLDPNNYNYYYNKYLKNSYIKKLKEESDPAIYNENSNNASCLNKINLDKNLNLNDLNSNKNNNKNNKYIKHSDFNIDPDKVFQNILNSNSMENNTNQKLNGENSHKYNNYNLILDSPENKVLEHIDVNSKNLNFYFYNLDKEDDSNIIKDDFEKNLSAAGICINPTNTSPKNNNSINNNLNSKHKNFSFIKSMHNIRIHLEKERSYPKGVYDIIELDCYLKKLLKEKSEITSLFYSDIKAMDKLYQQAKGEKLMEEIIENKELKEFLEKKSFHPQEFIPFNRHSKLLKKVSFIDKKDHTFDIDLKYFITSHETIEELLNKILFLDINQIFTYDDIFLKRLFDNIYSIYTYKNLLDLIAEEDKDSEYLEKLGNNNVNSSNNNCNKKKKKKKNTKKSVENNESSEKNNLLPNKNELAEKNNLDLEIQTKKGKKILKSNNYNDEKISINNLDHIGDIKININENKTIDKQEKQIKNKNYKDKAIYNNYINLNQDVYNSYDIVLDNKNNYNDDSKHDDSIIVIKEYNNDIININTNQVCKNNKEILEAKTTEKSDQEKSTNITEEMSNKEKNNLKLNSSHDEIKKSIHIKNKSDNNIFNFPTISKTIENDNEKNKKRKSNLNSLGAQVTNKSNNLEKTEIKSIKNKFDHKRANSKRDKRNYEYNNNIDDKYLNLKEEKKEKESIGNKEKLISEKKKIVNACNISTEIINLEKNPIKKIEYQAQNIIQNQKIFTQNVAANNNDINNNPLANLIHIGKENNDYVNIDKLKEKNDPYRDVVSKLIHKINNIDKNSTSEQNSNSFNENFIKKINNNNNQYFKNVNNNHLDAIYDNFKENLKKANLTELEKEKILKSPLNKESINLINNLNLFNDNQNSSLRNTNYSTNYVNYNEAENFKNENTHDKNENDTDTAYSSSNQSETNNCHAENSEHPCLHENSVDSFEINKLNQNLNSSNLINLKNNLRKNNNNKLIKANHISKSTKSELIDVKNINNYLISPKKNQGTYMKIDSNLDSEFKNGFTKNKDFDLINVNTKINFKKNSDEKRNSLNEKKIEKDINFINESKEIIVNSNRNTISNQAHFNVNKLNSEVLIKENFQEKDPNKIHFALNPLASIYKASNRKINISSNDLDVNKEHKNSNVHIKLAQENTLENQQFDLEGNYQESYFGNYDNAKKFYNKKYSNFDINSPNSSKSESSYFNGKNDLYTSYNMNNYYGNSAVFGNLSYNSVYSGGINTLSSNFPINNQKSYYSFNSPNSIKTKDFRHYQKFEKDKSFLNNNNSNSNINQNNNICESKTDQQHNSEQNNNIENIEKQKPNTFSENNKKSKNKFKKNSTNLNISKDDLNIIKSKTLNFTETNSQNENKKQKISNLINTSLNQNSINTNTIINSNVTPNSNNNTNTISSQNCQNAQIFSNNISLIPQSQVYQNYIPKNVNFRNFNFPVDITNSFNLGFNPNFNNYNFFYPLNMNNMSFMNMNLFNVCNTNNNYYDSNFYKKLHNDILEYNQKLEKNISFTKEIKSNVVSYLIEQIKDILNFLNVEINIYGSFANDLSIESSDIDLIVKYELNNNETSNMKGAQNNYMIDIEYIISYLTNSFNKNNCMDNVNPIYTASVPIIKLIIDPSKIKDEIIKKCYSNKEMKKIEELELLPRGGNEEKNFVKDQDIKEKSNIICTNKNLIKSAQSDKNFEIKDILCDLNTHLKLQKSNLDLLLELKDSDIYKNYNFNKEELEKVKIDITFSDVNFKSNSLNSKDQTQMAVEFTKNNNKKFPEIGYIIKIIKRLLQIENLNNSFKGGLSSFTLFLLVLAYTKIFRNKSFLNYYYGVFLVEFFNFYANFDFQNYYIDVNLDMPFLPLTELTENIPLIKNPFNSYLNAAKSSYRINELKELFGNISDKLNTIKNNFNSNISENLVYSIIFKK